MKENPMEILVDIVQYYGLIICAVIVVAFVVYLLIKRLFKNL